jgi:Na+/H+-dicarboxylate symporter
LQIYTKILIGMAIGVVLGLTIGPKSDLLKHDLYKARAGQVELRFDKADVDTRLRLSAVDLRLRQMEKIEVEKTDKKGAKHTVTDWVKVRFSVDERMLLINKGRFKRQLKKQGLKARPGTEVVAWLRIDNMALEGGGFQAAPTAVSYVGDTFISYVKPVGDVFMRMLKMVIVPLVFASLLVGIAGLGDVRKLGRLGGRTLVLYFLTTAIAVSIGLLMANLIQPGAYIDEAAKASLVAQFSGDVGSSAAAAAAAPSAIENILNIIPTNPAASFATGNMLQIIFFAVLFGIALTMLGDGEGQIVVTFFDKVQNAMVMVIHIVMKIAPYGVAALVADVIGNSGSSILLALLAYAGVVLLALAIHAIGVYGGLVVLKAKLPLGKFLGAIRPAQLIAFSTSSSSATLPVSMECAEEKLGVSNSVSSFVLPLGSTVNMDGTALYQGVAAVFIAQVFNMDLTIGDQVAIVATATAASVGAAGVPGAGMVTLAMVLTAAGIPELGLALILGMDRLLDMFRTAVNVTGDLAVTTVMAVAEGETLMVLDDAADAADPEKGFEGRLDKEPEALEPDRG